MRNCHYTNLAFVSALAFASVGCLGHDERTALSLMTLQRQQIMEVTRAFLTASAQRDTVAMKAAATDSVVMMTLAGDTALLRAAGRTLSPSHFEVARCSGRLEFHYRVDGEERTGRTEVVCRGDGWVITRSSLGIEH